jgi:hypothetical protein
MISLERHDEARRIVTGNRVDRRAVVEEIKAPSRHGFILPMSIGFFWRFDLLQIGFDGYLQRRFPDSSPSFFKPRYAWIAPFEFMQFAALRPSAGAAVTPAPSRRRVPPTYHST